MDGMRKFLRPPFVAAFIVALAACGSETSSEGPDAAVIRDAGDVARDAGTTRDAGVSPRDAGGGGVEEITEIIDSNGGTVELGMVTLEIPAGALEEPTPISIRMLQVASLPDPTRITGAAVDLGPDGQTFAVPVQLRIVNPGAPPTGSRKAILKLDEVNDVWNPVADSTFSGDVATGALSSFSIYAVGLVMVAQGPLGEGEVGCGTDDDCEGALVCADGIGPQFDASDTDRVCVQAHCTNDVRDEGERGVDCGGNEACGHCRPYSLTMGGVHRFTAHPVGTHLSPIIALAPDEHGGVYALARNGAQVQLDDMGQVVRSNFLDPGMTPRGDWIDLMADQNNDLIVLRQYGVTRHNANGTATWGTFYGMNAEVAAATIDCENNVIVVGRYFGSVMLVDGTVLPDHGSGFSGFVLKYAPTGELLHHTTVANLQLQHAKSITYGRPSIADCSYYVAGWTSGANDVNFTNDPANLLPGNAQDRSAVSAWAKFDRDDAHQWSHRIQGSVQNLPPLIDIHFRDFNPLLFGRGVGRVSGRPISGDFWGVNTRRDTGAPGIMFSGEGFWPSQVDMAFDTLASPIRVSGNATNETIDVGGGTFQVRTFADGVTSYFVASLTPSWIQVFELSPVMTPLGSFVMTTTAKGRPVVAGSMVVNAGHTVSYSEGTLDVTGAMGTHSNFVVGFEP